MTQNHTVKHKTIDSSVAKQNPDKPLPSDQSGIQSLCIVVHYRSYPGFLHCWPPH